MDVDVCVVIVTHNSSHVIVELLDSLPAALGSLTSVVVVVDNGSTDNTADIVESGQRVQVIRTGNIGYAAGINLGVANSGRSKAVLILNPDLILYANAVEYLMEALSLPNTGIVAPLVLEADGSVSTSLRREPTLRRALGLGFTDLPMFSESLERPESYRAPRIVDWALGAILLVSRECFDRLGGWDSSYFLYSEETDFCLRARDRGWLTRFDPRSRAVHIGAQSGQSPWTHSMLIVNRVRLYRRRHSAPAAWSYFALSVATELSRVLRRRPFAASAVRALIDPGSRPAELGCSDRLLPS